MLRVSLHAQARLLAKPGGDRVLGALSGVHRRRKACIHDEGMLQREVAAWEEERNEKGATVDWRFSVEDARTKLERLYPAQS